VIVLDTNIVIYLLDGRLAESLPNDRLCVSVISEIELLSYDRLDPKAESTIKALLNSLDVAGVTEEVKDQAIQLRRRHRLTIPDAIVAATAFSHGAELLTNDAKLHGIPNLRSRPLALKAN